MAKRTLLSIVMIAALSGCVSLAPQNTGSPTVELPEYLSLSSQEETINLSQIGWRSYFNDPQLIPLIETALQNNSDIKLALLNVQKASAQYGIEQANRYPQLNGQSSISYSGQNRDETSKNYQLQGTLSFELDFFGRLKNLSEAQLQRYLATQQAQRSTYMLLVAQVAQTYLNQQITLQKLATTEQQIANYQRSLQLIESRIISGESTYLDYEQAKGMLETALNSKVELQQQQQTNQHSLQNLLNRYDIKVKPVENLPLATMTIPGYLPSSALLTRPDIMQAEHQLIASNADIGVARAAFFPAISLTGSVGNSSTELTDLLSGATLWDLVPKITLPIFNGGKNQLNLELANIAQQQAIVEYEKTLHAAFKEVADLLTLRQSYQQQFAIQQRYLTTQNNALNFAEQGYLNGSTSYLAMLDAQRNILSTKLTLLTLKQNQQTNEINLFIALGGGWQE